MSSSSQDPFVLVKRYYMHALHIYTRTHTVKKMTFIQYVTLVIIC